jgi:small GTP-binding protein
VSATGDHEVPRFAVVGRVNKGKSSIVATLAEDDSVRIDARPGTTTEVREYPVRVDGRTLFVLVDTPGFEDAPRALAWMRSIEVTAADRPARVEQLVRTHAGSEDFVDERRLLQPILEGASVLYVVDGTKPFRQNYEAEMEILRWTGRPGMALVNRIGEGDHAAEWHRALAQYFPITRDFDAFSATFEERLRLLETFRELRPEWRGAIDDSVTALVSQRRRRRADAAGQIADLLVDELTHVEEIAVED